MSAIVLSCKTFDSADALAPVAPRIGQLIRLLGSDRDGEVVAAARALDRTLASVGEDLHGLASRVENSASARPSGQGPGPRSEWRAMARWLLYSRRHLSARERAFVSDMVNWSGEPTGRQEAWLWALVDRARSQRSDQP